VRSCHCVELQNLLLSFDITSMYICKWGCYYQRSTTPENLHLLVATVMTVWYLYNKAQYNAYAVWQLYGIIYACGLAVAVYWAGL